MQEKACLYTPTPKPSIECSCVCVRLGRSSPILACRKHQRA